jgi:protein-tyrosine phosphatase
MTEEFRVSGAVNLRDVGGLPAGQGVTRHGVLLRSGSLAALDAAGRDALAGVGLRRIIDLRDDDEVTREPSRLDARLPVPERLPLFLGSADSFFVNDIGLADLYAHIVAEAGERITNVVRGILADQPVLVHCTAGKDRTGVIVALVLSAAGVDRDAVVADYARTQAELPAERNRRLIAWLRMAHPRAEHIEELVAGSPPHAMRTLLEDIDRTFGSVPGYLRAAGLAGDEIAGLREVLVERTETSAQG